MVWTRGRRLGLDVGLARIGVAQCDPDGILATPVETVQVVDGPDGDPPWQAEVRRVLALATEYDAVGVILGIPINLRGSNTASTHMARHFGEVLEQARPPTLAIDYTDERLTTVHAAHALRQAGRSAKTQRAVIDQQAAVMILQQWVDTQRAAR